MNLNLALGIVESISGVQSTTYMMKQVQISVEEILMTTPFSKVKSLLRERYMMKQVQISVEEILIRSRKAKSYAY